MTSVLPLGKEHGMIAIRKGESRGRTKTGWLDSRHSFSFGHYYDPAHMGFGPLRVINEDRVAPGAGFPTHAHEDMEILSYVLAGALEHRDSLGTGSVIRPGDLQYMSAGSGIEHSEFNHSKTEPVHFLQIWLMPERRGRKPSYEQRSFALEPGRPVLAASPDGREGSLSLRQDAELYLARLSKGGEFSRPLQPGRKAWLQIARGRLALGGHSLSAGDGASLDGEASIAVSALEDSEILLFDMDS
jgi:redox-sensitive bicupin YhaK (pirin superfamily)